VELLVRLLTAEAREVGSSTRRRKVEQLASAVENVGDFFDPLR
jgi:hypothetical protein